MSSELERPQLCGVWCVIADEDAPHLEYHDTYAVYCSFGRYLEDEERDSFGVQDDEIFYYFVDGLDEFEAALDSDGEPFGGFAVLEYELVRVGGDNAPNS